MIFNYLMFSVLSRTSAYIFSLSADILYSGRIVISYLPIIEFVSNTKNALFKKNTYQSMLYHFNNVSFVAICNIYMIYSRRKSF